MTKPFKFRYVNEIVGVFVILVVLALIAGVILAGHAQRWFEPVHRLTLQFPSEGSFGLKKGAEVQILGATVGVVEEIRVNEDGSMEGGITIRGDFIRFVRADSRAIARKKFAVAGDSYIEITRGVGEELPEEGATMICEKDTEITETVEQVVQQVREVTLPAIEQVRLAIEEYTKLAADLRNPEGNLQQLLAHLNQIMLGLEKGEGTAGQILRDPSMANELRQITVKINESLAEVRSILEDVKQTTAKMPQTAESVSEEVDNLPGLVLQTQKTLMETERLIEGIQRHWLMRKYIEQAPASERIPPSAVQSSEGGAR